MPIEHIYLAGLARIQPCVGRASCPPAHVQAETLAAKMNDSFGDRLTGVFLEIIQPELWPRDNRTNGKFVADFLDTMRDNVPCHWFTGVYTNKSSFALIVGPYWMRRKYEDVRLWLPKHNVSILNLTDAWLQGRTKKAQQSLSELRTRRSSIHSAPGNRQTFSNRIWNLSIAVSSSTVILATSSDRGHNRLKQVCVPGTDFCAPTFLVRMHYPATSVRKSLAKKCSMLSIKCS